VCDLERCAVGTIAEEGRDLHGRRGLDRLGASDRERAGLVAARHTASALRGVEARRLGRPKRLVAKLRVSDVGVPNSEEKLLRVLEGDEAVVRKKRMGN
jgi:hypothetical protein